MASFVDVRLCYHFDFTPPRKTECHKAVLMAKSEYFRKEIAEDRYADNDGMTILDLWNLQTEDAGDFEAVIRYIYTSQYTTKGTDDWGDHMNRARVAWKFGVHEMEDKALAAFEQFFDDHNVSYIVQMLSRSLECESEKFQSRVKIICEKYIDQLEYEPGYALWTEDKAVMEKCLRHLAAERELADLNLEHEPRGVRGPKKRRRIFRRRGSSLSSLH